MFHPNEYDDTEEFSGSENDNGFDEDLEALRRACMITGTDPKDLSITNEPPSSIASEVPASGSGGGGDLTGIISDSEDDLEFVRKIQNRLAFSDDLGEPLSLEALCTLPPAVSDDDEDDFETLRVIQQRFSAYDINNDTKSSVGDSSKILEEVNAYNGALESTTSNNLLANLIDTCEGLPDSKEACHQSNLSKDDEKLEASSSIEWHQSNTLTATHDNFPRSAQAFVNAIKRNRAYQKFIRSKLTQIEARIEENNKLKERVKILKDFQISLRKRTGKALSQRKDPRIQLISAQKPNNSKDSEGGDKKLSAMHCGPAENSQVANYRMALMNHPVSLNRKKWSNAERENLGKGVRQQFQEMVLQLSVDQLSGSAGLSGDSNNVDNIFASVKDLEITPEMIREFIFKVDWDRLASTYVEGRSGVECEARWLNFEDPLINHNPWTREEDKSLLFIVQEKGIANWFDIAATLGTNRTAFQCLARYQRSLNASILKRDWSEDEDEQLCAAVKTYGESNWQDVASVLKGRTGTQCSNRWKKTLHPMRERVGRWTPDEDKRLRVATMLFGAKNWKKIAQFVPGRTQVQCRERWVNSLDPSVKRSEWTEEEDLLLESAYQEYGNCWSKVAACLPSRTDNQCWRRWKQLHPQQVPLLQAARKLRKAAVIGNFVDREKERPALGPSDFAPLPMINSAPEPDGANSSRKWKRKPRGKQESQKEKDAALSDSQEKNKSKKRKKDMQVCPEEILGTDNGDETETANKLEATQNKKIVRSTSRKKTEKDQLNKAKKPRKRCSEKQKSVEADGSTRHSILLEPPSSLEAGPPCGNGNSILGGSLGGMALMTPEKGHRNKAKKPRKRCSKKQKSAEADGSTQQSAVLEPPSGLEAGPSFGNGNSIFGESIGYTGLMMHGHFSPLDSSLETLLSIELTDAPGPSDAPIEGRPRKLPLKRKSCTESGEEVLGLSSHHSILLPPESLEADTTYSDNNNTLGGIINGSELTTPDHQSHMDQTPVAINNIEQADVPGGFDTSAETRPAELQLGNKKLMEPNEEGCRQTLKT